MIILTEDQKKKIKLLDSLLNNLSTEEAQALAEQFKIVSKLKGESETGFPIIANILREHNDLQNEVFSLRSRVDTLTTDLDTLIKAVNTAVFTPVFNSDFQNLKNKRSIY
jgi:hypothetical protein